ncbi:MAG: DinB family protein [Planctomycetota bacterium]
MIEALEDAGRYLPDLLRNVSDEDARWKPPSQNWSILEILCHLIDEEVDDFRKRIMLTLHDPNQQWPSINPELWAIDRNYNQADLQKSIQRFASERRDSIRWLKSLEEPNWFQTYQHPHIGPIRAGDLLVSWVAHDQLHVRQLAKRRYELINRYAGDFTFEYAGEWTA